MRHRFEQRIADNGKFHAAELIENRPAGARTNKHLFTLRSSSSYPMKSHPLFLTVLTAGATLLAGQISLPAQDKPVPNPPPADFIEKLDPQMQAVVEAVIASGALPYYELDAEKARKQPLPGVAALVAARKEGKSVKPETVGERDKIKVAGGAGEIEAILYRPAGDKGKGGPTLPALVYFHGGGFVLASPTAYETSARALADAGGCVVISVSYRLAPENKFPAAVEDAYAATQHIIAHAGEYNIDPKRVAVGGESAGGNLATEVCLLVKERGGAMPVHQLLIYPVTDWASERPSHAEYGESPILPEKNLPRFEGMYFNNNAEAKKPLASPMYADDLKGLPPATIINAQEDILVDDGAAYAEKIEAAGVPVKREVYKGVTHEFFGMGVAVDRARAAESFAGERLQKAFAQSEKVTKK